MRTKYISKICKCKRFANKVPRLPVYDLDLGIKTKLKHYLAFSVDKPIYVFGFDIFGTTTRKELEIEYGIMRPDICNEDNQKIFLQKCKVFKEMDGHRKHITLKFDSPVKVEKFVKYIIYANVDFYLPYRGIDGQSTVLTNDVRFTFTDFIDSSLSNVREGNFPTIYFKPTKLDNTFLVELDAIGRIVKSKF